MALTPAMLRAVNPEPSGSVSPSTITNDSYNVTFERAGTCPNGFDWSEATLWLLSGDIVLGNEYTALPYYQTITGSTELTQGKGTYQIQFRLVDVDYNYTDQWINITVNNYSTPVYSPSFWNTGLTQEDNNCYDYANNETTNNFAQPGYAAGHTFTASEISASLLEEYTGYDGAKSSNPSDGSTPIAILTDAGSDFHFARLDSVSNGVAGSDWSHKPGSGSATNVDASSNTITNPATANWNFGSGTDYTYDATYYTPSDYVQGGGHLVISGPGIGGGGGGE